MEKVLIIFAASLIASKEATNTAGFPISGEEGWQFLFVIVTSIIASLANESVKRKRDIPFYAPNFWGSVVLGSLAGLAFPLLIDTVYTYITHQSINWKTSVGLAILGAYMGQETLKAAYAAVIGIGQVVGKLKGVNVSYTPPTAPPKAKEDEKDA